MTIKAWLLAARQLRAYRRIAKARCHPANENLEFELLKIGLQITERIIGRTMEVNRNAVDLPTLSNRKIIPWAAIEKSLIDPIKPEVKALRAELNRQREREIEFALAQMQQQAARGIE